MSLQRLLAHLEGDGIFQETFAGGSESARLVGYAQHLRQMLGFFEGSETGADTRWFLLHAAGRSRAFCEETRRRNEEYWDARIRPNAASMQDLRDEVALPLLRQYRGWLLGDLDDVTTELVGREALSTLGADERDTLVGELAEIGRSGLVPARQAGLAHLEAKAAYSGERKARLKAEIMRFLGVDRFARGVFGLQTDKTADAIHLLELEVQRAEQELARLRAEEPAAEAPAAEADVDDEWVVVEQWEQIECEVMRGAQAKDYLARLRRVEETGAEHARATAAADAAFARTDHRVDALTRRVAASAEALRPDVGELAVAITRQKGELELVMLEQQALVDRVDRGERAIAGLEAGSAERVRREHALAELRRRLSEVQDHNDQVSRDLAFVDAKYRCLVGTIGAQLGEQERLVQLRDAAKDELEWIKKLNTADHTLNAYVSAFAFSFDLLLGFGELVGGDHGGRLGLGGTFAAQGALRALASTGDAAFRGLMTGVAAAGALSQSQAYDTGSLALSLKLGLSFGLPGEVGAKAGLALVYDAGLVQDDSRRFKTISTLTVKASAKVELPKAFSASIEADLLKDKTTLSFKDHYQWAAWLAQKWANIRAWVQAATVYQRAGNNLDQPTPKDLERMRELATITLANSPELKALLEKVTVYMREPIARVEQREVLGGFAADVGLAGEVFSAGFEGERPGEPRYVRRETSEDGRVWEEEKEGRQWSVGGNAKIPQVSVGVVYSSTTAHQNPDLEGERLVVKVALAALGSTAKWVEGKESEALHGDFSRWIEEHVVPKAEALKAHSPVPFGDFASPFGHSEVATLTTKMNLAALEIQLVKATIGAGTAHERSKWVLAYWRPVFQSGVAMSASFPVGHGVNVDLGGSLTFGRSYREQLGTNTLAYVRTVYHGFANRTPIEDQDHAARPVSALGRTLWQRWVDAHPHQLYALCQRIAEAGTWAHDEALALHGGGALVDALGRLHLPLEFDAPAFARARTALETFLATSRRDDYQPRAELHWEPVRISRFEWSLNPYALISAAFQARSAEAQLDAAKHQLGAQHRDLATQVARDAEHAHRDTPDTSHFIPDAEAPRCMGCRTTFGLVTRRHHCRWCGGVFCSACCSQKGLVPARGFHTPVLVCKTCFPLTQGGRLARVERRVDEVAASRARAPAVSSPAGLLGAGLHGAGAHGPVPGGLLGHGRAPDAHAHNPLLGKGAASAAHPPAAARGPADPAAEGRRLAQELQGIAVDATSGPLLALARADLRQRTAVDAFCGALAAARGLPQDQRERWYRVREHVEATWGAHVDATLLAAIDGQAPVDCGGGGNCGPYSLAHQLHVPTDAGSKQAFDAAVRKRVADHLRGEIAYFSGEVPLGRIDVAVGDALAHDTAAPAALRGARSGASATPAALVRAYADYVERSGVYIDDPFLEAVARLGPAPGQRPFRMIVVYAQRVGGGNHYVVVRRFPDVQDAPPAAEVLHLLHLAWGHYQSIPPRA